MSAVRARVEIEAGGAADPDASKSAALLAAYFHAEHMRAARRRLSLQLAIVAVVWIAASALTRFVPLDTLVGGLVVIAGAVAAIAIAEWRADTALANLLASGSARAFNRRAGAIPLRTSDAHRS